MRKLLIILITLSLIAFTIPAMAGSSSDADADASAGASALIDDHSTNISKSKVRPNGGAVPIPGQPGWFTEPTSDGEFVKMAHILRFGKVFSEGALENMAKGGRTRVTYGIVNEMQRESTRDKMDRRILVVIDHKKIEEIAKTGTHVAYVNGAAKNGKTNSVQVMASMALEALQNGANVIVYSAEGAHRKVEAFGWGVGFSHTKASENNMSTGGTGISGGEAGPEDRPWLQGHAFVDNTVQEMLNSL